MAKHGHFHRLHVKHKAAHRSLAEFKKQVFRDHVSMALHEFDQRLGTDRFPCVQFASRTHPVFSKWHRYFYRDRKKIVPKDIAMHLSPLSMAVWFMDDGAADYAGVTFQTHSFELSEVELLVNGINERYDLATRSRRNRSRWIIYLPSRTLSRFVQLIRPHLLEEFVYKTIPRRTRTP